MLGGSSLDKFKPVTLTKDEVKFFDDQADIIIKAILPPADKTPEKERSEMLEAQDEREQSQEDLTSKDDPFEEDLRRAIRTMEVMGSIIKNRAGSLEKTKLEEIFKEAMNIYLRILFFFFEIIKNEENQMDIIDFISKKLEKITEEKEKKLGIEKVERISRSIFWNTNFFVVYGCIKKIVHSLGSDKLMKVVEKVCDEIDTPASFIVKHGIFMWYDKNLQIEELASKIEEKNFSMIAERVIKLMIVNHCALHSITYKDRQRIENQFGIPAKKLLQDREAN